jgi:hypothetical protein
MVDLGPFQEVMKGNIIHHTAWYRDRCWKYSVQKAGKGSKKQTKAALMNVFENENLGRL